MDYTVALYLERLPGAAFRDVQIGGIQQRCLCIPVTPDVFFLAKSGKPFLQINLREKEDILDGQTHTIYFSYPNPEMKKKENTNRWYGRCAISQAFEMNEDKTNLSTFTGRGIICLDDIPQESIYKHPITGKTYVHIGIRPLVELDRGKNNSLIFVDPDYGADGGRRASLQNGYDAPLIELGRLKDLGCVQPVDNPEEPENTAEDDEQRKLGDYDF